MRVIAAITFFISVIFGFFYLVNKSTGVEDFNYRDYILVSNHSSEGYKGHLPFRKGTIIKEIVSYFGTVVNKVFRKEGNKWTPVGLETKIYEDTQIKIT